MMRPRPASPMCTRRSSKRSTVLVLTLGVLVLALAACTNRADNAAPQGSASTPSASPSPPEFAPEPATVACDKPLPAPEVCNATVDIPSWGPSDEHCPRGPVTIIGGRYQGHAGNRGGGIMRVLPADVDHDGVAEQVVLASCTVGDPGIVQVFVVDHSASGALHTMGQIIGYATNPVGDVLDLAASRDGAVRVQVSDVFGSDGTAIAAQVVQWRTFAWNGQRFIQTAGSTSFDADPAAHQLTISVAPVIFAKAQGLLRHATVRITVHNTGTTAAPAVAVRLIIDDWLDLTPGPCDPKGLRNAAQSCPTDIAAGGTQTITFNPTITAADADTLIAQGGQNHNLVVIQLRLADQLYNTINGTATFQ